MATSHRGLSIFPEVHVEARSEPVFVGDGVSEDIDPDWTLVDASGHGHFVEKGKPKGDRLPTLKWVPEGCSMGHGEDCDAEGHYECLLCAETIAPATKTTYGPTHVPGPTTITMTMESEGKGRRMTTVWEFGPGDVERVRTAVAATLLETLDDRVIDQTVTFGGF
jgi:hypothetical protein